VSLAKAGINSDRPIAEKLTSAWLPCQQSSALQWLVHEATRDAGRGRGGAATEGTDAVGESQQSTRDTT
jgi:hypothetical protein